MKLRLFIFILALAFVFGLSFTSIADDDDDDDDQQDSSPPTVYIFEVDPADYSIIEEFFDPDTCVVSYAVEVGVGMYGDDEENSVHETFGDALLDMVNAYYMARLPVVLACADADDDLVSKVAAGTVLDSFMENVTKALKKKDGKVTLVEFERSAEGVWTSTSEIGGATHKDSWRGE